MMDENRFDPHRADAAGELSPALRRAVDGVLRDPLPDGVERRALALARQIGVSRLEPNGAGQRRRSRAAGRVFVVAASVGLAAACAWWYWGETPNARVVVHPSRTEPGGVPGAAADPCIPQPHRLPSLWAYRQAAGQSPETLDAMLDRDARRTLGTERNPFQAEWPLGFARPTL